MRPVNKSVWKDDPIGTRKIYSPYRTALQDLIDNLGDFCSYCELQVYEISLDVEHVDDKHNNPAREEDWDNFLLACKNCNSIKGTKSIIYLNLVFPHIQNTYKIFSYLTAGVISINSALPAPVQQRVQNLIDLVGLDRLPGNPHYSLKDKRWQYRMNTFTLASRYLNDYKKGNVKVQTIVDLALSKGFWSIWMQIFKGETAVEDELIDSFKSTFKNCRTTDINRK